MMYNIQNWYNSFLNRTINRLYTKLIQENNPQYKHQIPKSCTENRQTQRAEKTEKNHLGQTQKNRVAWKQKIVHDHQVKKKTIERKPWTCKFCFVTNLHEHFWFKNRYNMMVFCGIVDKKALWDVDSNKLIIPLIAIIFLTVGLEENGLIFFSYSRDLINSMAVQKISAHVIVVLRRSSAAGRFWLVTLLFSPSVKKSRERNNQQIEAMVRLRRTVQERKK